MLHKHWQLVHETLGEGDGVYIVDESGFLKKGIRTVGVRASGVLGKVENRRVGVYGAYASRCGCTLVDHHMFLPKEWFDQVVYQAEEIDDEMSCVQGVLLSALALTPKAWANLVILLDQHH